MNLGRIRYKVLVMIGITLTLAFGGLAYYYMQSAEEAIFKDHQRALHKVTDSVARGIETIMVENHAEIMKEYSRRLRAMTEISDLVIMRADGTEAFRDNRTIEGVNARLGGQAFNPYVRPEIIPREEARHPVFQEVIKSGEERGYEKTDVEGRRFYVFLDPLANGPRCLRCHGDDHRVRGVIQVTSSLASVEKEILQVRVQTLLLLGFSLGITMLATGYMLGRSVVRPIERVTQAMSRISAGDLDYSVPVRSRDELGRMAESFNRMTSDLRNSYGSLLREKDKLSTIIQSAREAIIVTDAGGEVVLVNPAAEQILGKTRARLREEGFLLLLDDPALMRRALDKDPGAPAEKVAFNGRMLLLSAAAIVDDKLEPVGSAALIRDVTDQQRLMDELLRISITDALTGLFNRRHLDDRLKVELERSRRAGKPLSVILFDVDHFKRFNDTHGHDQGDRVLQAMGRLMKAVLRPYDLPCRYGGEEFVAILPVTDAAGAAIAAERLRRRVEEEVVDGLKVTISLGVATYPDTPAEAPGQLLEAADAALYRAKENGRNQVVAANSLGTAI